MPRRQMFEHIDFYKLFEKKEFYMTTNMTFFVTVLKDMSERSHQ